MWLSDVDEHHEQIDEIAVFEQQLRIDDELDDVVDVHDVRDETDDELDVQRQIRVYYDDDVVADDSHDD